ncbi:CHAT domain-containing protein [Desulfoplanes sp.]
MKFITVILIPLIVFMSVQEVYSEDTASDISKIADSRTFITYYKYEKKFKELEILLLERLEKIEDECQSGKKNNCDLEGKLYVFDDLADLYTYGLVNFKKAKEYNLKTLKLYRKMHQKNIKSTNISKYFNTNRFLYYSFYAKDTLFSDEEDMNFAFDDDYVECIRQSDFEKILDRVSKRQVFIGEKLKADYNKFNTIHKKHIVSKKLFLLYSGFIDSSPSYSTFEKGFLKAQVAFQALDNKISDQDVFIKAIIDAEEYMPNPSIVSNPLITQDKVNRLNYWATLALVKKGQYAKALEYHKKLITGIEKLEKLIAERYQTMISILQENYEKELNDTNTKRLSKKKFLAWFGKLSVIGAKIGATALALANDAAHAAQGDYSSSSTSNVYKLLWEDKDADSGIYDTVMSANFLNSVYTVNNDDVQHFTQFMTPYSLLLNRYMNKYEMSEYMVAIGDAYLTQNNLELAAKQYKEAIKITECQRLTIYSEKERIAYFAFKQTLYSKMIKILVALNHFELALEYVERSKSRSFLDILGSNQLQLKSSQQNCLASEYAQSRSEINSMLEDKDISSEQAEYAHENLLRGLEIIGKNLDNNSYDEIYSLSNVKTLEILKIHQLLQDDIVIVEYYITNIKLYIFVVSSYTLDCVSVDINYKNLTNKIFDLRESITNLSFDKKKSNNLYNILISPVKCLLDTDRIVIIPHKVLHYMPFQALMNETKYLIDDYAISYAPSATVLSMVKQKNVIGGKKALIIGNPTGNIPYSAKEALNIGKILPESEVLIGDEGTESLVKKQAENYKIIHIASHAVFDPCHPLASKILLYPTQSDDGQLTTDELFSCHWHASLVTLSACQTGFSKYSSGDELIGLQRGVFFAGTRSLLASSWKVDDKSTNYLMTQFYKYLTSYPKDRALEKAQQDTLRHYKEPFYWAAFQLIGDSNYVYDNTNVTN